MSEPVSVPGFTGINNRLRETDLPPEALREAVNVDLSDSGAILKRRGYSELVSATYAHSLWSDRAIDYALAVLDGSLTLIRHTGETSALATVGINDVSYAELNGDVYYTNGAVTGRISSEANTYWGLFSPPMPTVAAAGEGALPAGRYQVTTSWVDTDGEEYGAGLAQLVTLTAQGGITVSNLLTGSGVAYTQVWLSPTDGDALYWAVDVPTGTSSVVLDTLPQGKLLETQFLEPPPPGNHVRRLKSRLFVAQDAVIWYTDPLRPSLIDPRHNWVQMPETVTMMEAVEDGLYVGTDKRTLFLAGTDPNEFRQIVVDNKGVIPGTGTTLPSHAFGNPDAPMATYAACWWNRDGVFCVGYPSGQVQEVTRRNLSIPPHEKGATAYREINGINQVLSVLRQTGTASQAAATDSVTADVIRAGISLDGAFQFQLEPGGSSLLLESGDYLLKE